MPLTILNSSSRFNGVVAMSIILCVLPVQADNLYGHQICIVVADAIVTTDRVTSGLTHFSRSQGPICKNQKRMVNQYGTNITASHK